MTDQTNNKALERYERILSASNIDTGFAPMLSDAESKDPASAARMLNALIDHATTVKAMQVQNADKPTATATHNTDNDMEQTRRMIEGIMLNGAGTAETCLHPAADHTDTDNNRNEDEQTARLRRQIEQYMFSGIRA